jgi:Tfp pilus assembly protein PilN
MRAFNLIPREESKRRQKSMTLTAQLALMLPIVVVALLAAGYLMASSKVADNKSTLRALQDELAAIPPVATEPQPDADLVVQRDQRISALALALQSRVAWDRVLRQVSSVLPEDVWLTALSATSPTATPAPPPPAATTTTESSGTTTATTTTTPAPPPASPAPLTLDGYTYSQEGVARLMSRLSVIPELEDVKLLSSTESTVADRSVFQFSISATVSSQAGS